MLIKLRCLSSLGPQGHRMISGTICRILNRCREQAESCLAQSIHDLVNAHPQHFDSAVGKNPPKEILPLSRFIHFILSPHVATLLIAEDMKVKFDKALDIKDQSNDFGDMFNWNVDDPELAPWNDYFISSPSPRSTPNRSHQNVLNSPLESPQMSSIRRTVQASPKPPKHSRKSVGDIIIYATSNCHLLSFFFQDADAKEDGC